MQGYSRRGVYSQPISAMYLLYQCPNCCCQIVFLNLKYLVKTRLQTNEHTYVDIFVLRVFQTLQLGGHVSCDVSSHRYSIHYSITVGLYQVTLFSAVLGTVDRDGQLSNLLKRLYIKPMTRREKLNDFQSWVDQQVDKNCFCSFKEEPSEKRRKGLHCSSNPDKKLRFCEC